MKMNYRKDIYEKVKFMLKDKSNVNINCSKLAHQYGFDRRTVSKAINAVKNNLPPPKANKPRKTEGISLVLCKLQNGNIINDFFAGVKPILRLNPLTTIYHKIHSMSRAPSVLRAFILPLIYWEFYVTAEACPQRKSQAASESVPIRGVFQSIFL